MLHTKEHFIICKRVFSNPPFNTGFPVNISFFYRVCTVCFLLLFVHNAISSGFAKESRRDDSDKSSVAEILDSLVYATYFKDEYFSTSSKEQGRPGFPSHFVPQYSDSVYAARIAALDRKTPFNLVFNSHVRGFIRVYAVDKRNSTAKILGLSKVYFPLFEEHLDRYNVPLEMKYLAIVESALNPTAVSRAGARGLWQFMYGTGKMYGLESSSFVEDRYDPYKATLAASRHLRDLYKIYGDWFLALAAYNSGPGNVNKAIRRAGGVKDYWAIWDYLPAETRGYVPAFIAVNYIMNYYKEHNIIPVEPGYLYHDIDTLRVSRMLSFEQINETIGVSMQDLQFLNPQYKLGIIPAAGYSSNVIRLPRRFIGQFQRREQEIYAYKSKSVLEREQLLTRVQSFEADAPPPASIVSSSGAVRKVHFVRKGQDIGMIARYYRCEPSEIVRWNNLQSTSLTPGQQLIVFDGDDQVSANTAVSATVPVSSQEELRPNTAAAAKKKERLDLHTVKRGETIASISREYGVSIRDIAERNGLTGRMSIQPGQKITIGSSVKNASSRKSRSAMVKYHKVKKGDTLISIADRYGVSIGELTRWNNIGVKKPIKPGQKLKVASR
ncbi:MAG: LysM peptidoglycan-binding domain-containing protein [Chlorobium sp.]|nr:LysM peptidoglycan-binding domain-containing protein [Chlorobium sp.]MCF8270952.1 LysM peptidoglycan-binding domain-containing protein [Chlorobium sp.]MCF8287326.1 LysM peptidoglycan-binding domain-containing protein [Chlorobium sp.]MCF8291412.1 LysM peptidoglycan-binding domain-containing protein [Chlorobium sp.]MCF8384960.1 LysM peptidoglycan-binding domain-containing protein [Chlorobium sp.]